MTVLLFRIGQYTFKWRIESWVTFSSCKSLVFQRSASPNNNNMKCQEQKAAINSISPLQFTLASKREWYSKVCPSLIYKVDSNYDWTNFAVYSTIRNCQPISERQLREALVSMLFRCYISWVKWVPIYILDYKKQFSIIWRISN